MIPQDKCAAVLRGLREAFGVDRCDQIRQLTGGQTTSLVYRIEIRDSAFLLKIIMRTEAATRRFNCLRAAAEAAIAPRVWYANVEDRVFITDFVLAQPLSREHGLTLFPALLRDVHALPAFPEVTPDRNTSFLFLLNEGPAIDGFLQRFRTANILTPGERGEMIGVSQQLAAAYRTFPLEWVSSHNDLFKPDNALFDGERLWLVDWEAAFLNDRYADLAVVANLVVVDEADEEIFLRAYLGHTPDDYQRARLFLAQQWAHLFYAMAFLLFGSGASDAPEQRAPCAQTLQKRFWDGEFRLTDPATKRLYGDYHREKLLKGVRGERFAMALEAVARMSSAR